MNETRIVEEKPTKTRRPTRETNMVLHGWYRGNPTMFMIWCAQCKTRE